MKKRTEAVLIIIRTASACEKRERGIEKGVYIMCFIFLTSIEYHVPGESVGQIENAL